jgi:hypothetical protein
MLRVMGLALLLVAGVAVPSAAADGRAGEIATSAAYRDAASHDARPPVQQSATPLQLTRPWTGAQWSTWGASSAGFRRDVVNPTTRIATLPPGGGDIGTPLPLPWLSQGKPGLRLPVTERLSFGVGYRRLQGEDLWRRYAEAGSVDYDSHDFLLRAHWRF